MMIRLLIADDERLEREALAEMVTRRFVEHEIVLEEAENGRKAADTAILWGADLILMDIEMPGMNGLDAARAVLAQRPGCRVIFVTAYSLFQYAHEAVHLGACDYLLKPVDPDELEASIRRAIRQQQDQMGQLLDGLLETGQLAGELCDFYSPWEQLCQNLTPRQTVYLDAFLAASYPEQPAPQKLLAINAKQLPCYGGSVETAAADLAFYRKERYACLVLCGNRRRGEILHDMLREREIPAILAFPLTQLPPAGTIYLTDGTLPACME